MTLAWFRPSTLARDAASALDDTAPLIAALHAIHDVEVFTRANAHDFVWKHFRAPHDLCVFELDNTPSHDFVWPYLLHYGGVLLLRTVTLHDSRAHALVGARRRDDYIAEFTFNEGSPAPGTATPPYMRQGTWPMLRVPLMAARVTVVPHKGVADLLQEQYPQTRVVYAPLGVRQVQEGQYLQRPPAVPGAPVTLGMVSTDRVEILRRALARAQEGGAPATLLIDTSPERVIHDADVIVTLPWPAHGTPLTLALAAMAAGKPLVVLETPCTADWPALNPQTWRPRGLPSDAPAAVSVDVRDEEHSLAVAIRRLSLDPALRARLGGAAHAWWRAHATVRGAADAWDRILREAATLALPARPADWPAHLTADGTERAREILAEFATTVDLF
jgi:hypothetical protein